MYFWAGANGYDKKRGIFGKVGKACNMTCVQWYEPSGKAISGGTNGYIYIWEGNQCFKSFAGHSGGKAIHTLKTHGSTTISGGADHKLNIYGATGECETSH